MVYLYSTIKMMHGPINISFLMLFREILSTLLYETQNYTSCPNVKFLKISLRGAFSYHLALNG